MGGVKILFISHTAQVKNPIFDGSTRYRTYHPAEVLRSEGALVSVTTQQEFINNPSFDYNIYVFHRPGKALENLLVLLRDQRKILIADYDDLIFGKEKEASFSSAVRNNLKTLEEIKKYFLQNLEILNLFNSFSVSTSPLANKIVEFFPDKNVQVVHNFIPESILRNSYQEKLILRRKDSNLILYCTGTTSHIFDFKTIEEQILTILNSNTELKFVIIGQLSYSKRISNHPRIFHNPIIEYPKLFRKMSAAGFTLAPLEINPFNVCKSNVKFLESSVAGNTLIATPIPDMERSSKGKILLPKTSNEWLYYLSHLSEIDIQKNSIENFNCLINNFSSQTFLIEFSSLLKEYKDEF